MIIVFEDAEWELDLTRVSYQQAMVIQLYTGMSIGEWEDSIDVKEKTDADGNPTGELENPPPEWLKSVGSLYWLMRAQAGDKIPIAEMDFDFGGFVAALMEGLAAELERSRLEAAARADAAERPDPTPLSSPPSPRGGRQSRAPASRRAGTRQPPALPAAAGVTGSG